MKKQIIGSILLYSSLFAYKSTKDLDKNDVLEKLIQNINDSLY